MAEADELEILAARDQPVFGVVDDHAHLDAAHLGIGEITRDLASAFGSRRPSASTMPTTTSPIEAGDERVVLLAQLVQNPVAVIENGALPLPATSGGRRTTITRPPLSYARARAEVVSVEPSSITSTQYGP